MVEKEAAPLFPDLNSAMDFLLLDGGQTSSAI